jgi:predicted AlkP superfamily pyrophosphatase or phosphodiesterase
VVRSDPRWWRGEPIWNTAERQGRRAAGLFWPGDDVEILGRRPSDYLPYDDAFPNDRRVELVLEWLSRPPATRPRLVLVYFSTVDVASHAHGPVSGEALAAAATIDTLLGRLADGVATLGLAASTDIVVVSDHGMAETRPERVVILDDLLDLSGIDVIETGPSVRLRPKGEAPPSRRALARWTRATFAALAGKHPRLRVYQGSALPARFRAGRSARLAPIIGLADEGWVIQTRAERDRWIADGGDTRGEHGFDPALPSMHGLFVAAGPSFRAGHRLPPFESVHVYELLCRLLGVRPAKNDGDPRVLAGAVAPSGR